MENTEGRAVKLENLLLSRKAAVSLGKKGEGYRAKEGCYLRLGGVGGVDAKGVPYTERGRGLSRKKKIETSSKKSGLFKTESVNLEDL